MLALLFCGCALGAIGCKESKKLDPAPSATPGKPGAVPAEPGKGPKAAEAPKPLALGHRYPVGPEFVIIPGNGVGPIRFGATRQTVERHMENPCDLATETRCLYVRQAIDFTFKDGVLVAAKAERRDRKVSGAPKDGDQYYGSFRGVVRPSIMMGLHRHIVIEEYGEPLRKVPVDPPGPDGLVDRHYYDGVMFEYDRIDNGNIVLSAIEVTPSETATALPSGFLEKQAAAIEAKRAENLKKTGGSAKAPSTKPAPVDIAK